MVPVTEGRKALDDSRDSSPAPSLSQSLRLAGATPIEVEFIAIEPSADAGALERAVRDW